MNSLEKPLKKASVLLAVALCSGLLAGCATPKGGENKIADKNIEIDSDPIEPLNRAIFQFNHTVDGVILKPIAQGYSEVVPERGRVMVSNLVSNVKEPVTFANSVLQLDAKNSFSTLWRFMINSSVGVGGLFDAASEVGLKNRDTGLGDTFAMYGADAGPYIIIPILGPSTVRDGLGRLGDTLMDPVSYTKNSVFYSVVAVKTIDARYHNLKLLDDVYKSSLDPYATIRSGYMQHRASEIKKAINERNKSLGSAKNQDAK